MAVVSTPRKALDKLSRELSFAKQYGDKQVEFTIENAYEKIRSRIYDVVSLQIFRIISKLNNDIENNIPTDVQGLNHIEVEKFELSPQRSAFAFNRKGEKNGFLVLQDEKIPGLKELKLFRYVPELDDKTVEYITTEYDRHKTLTPEITNMIDNGSINTIRDRYSNVCGERDIDSILENIGKNNETGVIYGVFVRTSSIDGIDPDMSIEIRDMSSMNFSLVQLDHYRDLCDLFNVDEKINETNKNMIFPVSNYSADPLDEIADFSALQCKTLFDRNSNKINEMMSMAKDMSLDIRTRYCFNDTDIRIHFEPEYETPDGKKIDILLESNIDLFCNLDFVNVFQRENGEIVRWDAYYCARNPIEDEYCDEDFDDDDDHDMTSSKEMIDTINKISRDYEKHVDKHPSSTSAETVGKIKNGEIPENIAFSFNVKTSEFTMYDLAISNSYLSYAKYVIKGAHSIISTHHRDGKLSEYDLIEVASDDTLSSFDDVKELGVSPQVRP